MKVSRRVLARFVARAIADSSVKSREKLVAELAAYIVEHKLQGQIELILADISANLSSLGHIEASVTTAHPLTDTLRAELTAYVRRVENAKSVVLQESVDPSLIGGVIVETPNQRLDSSLATKLKRLRNA